MKFICYGLSILALSMSATAADLAGLLKSVRSESTAQQTSTHAASVDGLNEGDVAKGLKEALSQGAAAAVGKLGLENGFYGNEKIRIPLPAALQKAERLLHAAGQGKSLDELHLTINRAAEAATPQAKKLLLDAIRKVSVQDAKNILTGGNDAATQYFRKATAADLHDKFLPIVSKSVGKLGVAEKYNQIAGKASKLGLLDEKQASMQEYVTQKALDGLFVMIADEELAIRQNPMQRTGVWIKKVFGAIGQ